MVRVTMEYARESYLRFLLDLLHHVNFQVPAVVHLINIAGDNISNAQISIVSDIQPGPVVFQQFFLGRASS